MKAMEAMKTMKAMVGLTIVLFVQFIFSGLSGVAQNQNAEDSVKYYMTKGKELVKAKKFDEALKEFEKAQGFDPGNEEVIMGRLGLNMQRGRVETGIKVVEEWTKVQPKNPRAWFTLFMVQAETNHPADALKSVDILIALQPDTAVNYIGRGQVLSALDRDEEALKSLDKAISLSPKNQDAWNIKLSVLIKMKKYDEALKSFDEAQKHIEMFGSIYYNRACVYSLTNKKSLALADLKKAFEMDPGLKEGAAKDSDLKNLYEDKEFKDLIK